uniref:Uncharacterized protein n=1 Tax=Schistocephalus solidus TaxID=70667 RepID=A0A0X3NT41_SCHSO
MAVVHGLMLETFFYNDADHTCTTRPTRCQEPNRIKGGTKKLGPLIIFHKMYLHKNLHQKTIEKDQAKRVTIGYQFQNFKANQEEKSKKYKNGKCTVCRRAIKTSPCTNLSHPGESS